MRTAIFAASMNITTLMTRIAEGYGITIAPIRPEWLPDFYLYLFIAFVVMDVVDFYNSQGSGK